MPPTDDQNPNTKPEPQHSIVFARSGNVKSALFDPAASTVVVEFVSGDRYTFGNFTEKLMAEWNAAKSAGGWFDANIKKKPSAHPMVAVKKVEPKGEVKTEPEASPRASATPAPTSPATAPAADIVEVGQVNPTIRERARTLYAAYVRNSGNKAYDGRECPPWHELGAPVQSHWCAVVIEVDRQLADAQLAPEHRQKLVMEVEHLKKKLVQTEGAANHRLEAAVLERTKTEAAETERLRVKVAELEEAARAQRRQTGARPWRDPAVVEARKANEPAPAPEPPQTREQLDAALKENPVAIGAGVPTDDHGTPPDTGIPSPRRT